MITLKTLPNSTAQQVFDQAKEHLLRQNCKSTRGISKRSAYRGNYGTKCAAGCFIGDDEYNKEMEGKSWDQLVYIGLVPSDHRFLIGCLQNVHDLYTVDEWPDQLKVLAQRTELKF